MKTSDLEKDLVVALQAPCTEGLVAVLVALHGFVADHIGGSNVLFLEDCISRFGENKELPSLRDLKARLFPCGAFPHGDDCYHKDHYLALAVRVIVYGLNPARAESQKWFTGRLRAFGDTLDHSQSRAHDTLMTDVLRAIQGKEDARIVVTRRIRQFSNSLEDYIERIANSDDLDFLIDD